MKPSISFVVPVKSDAIRLAACMRSILKNGTGNGQIEIIVVDNGSTDDSAAVARSFGARVVSVTNGRVSALRNVGAEQASADVLAFIDADNEIVAGWVYAALSCLKLTGVGAAGALCHAPADGTWVQRVYDHLRGAGRGQTEANWLGSGNLAVRRDVFTALGGFDTSLEACEDVEFCHRLRAGGYRILSDARLKNIHHGDPRTIGEVFSGERWRGRDNLRVSFRRPITWSTVPSAVIPMVHVGLMAAAIAGLVATAVAGRTGLLVLAAALLAFILPTWLRVGYAVVRDGHLHVGRMLQAFVVASAYDCGRALALVLPAPHRRSKAPDAELA